LRLRQIIGLKPKPRQNLLQKLFQSEKKSQALKLINLNNFQGAVFSALAKN
jgi:hypothetical protein